MPSMGRAQTPLPPKGIASSPTAACSFRGGPGKIDAGAEANGESVKNAKLSKDGDVLHVMTGPAVTYWNPANTASGNYTVKATFTEPKYMNLNDHPHPYGIVIAGNDLGTAAAELSLLRRIRQRQLHRARVRSRAVSIERPACRAECRRAQGRGKDQPVTQEIAVSVKGDKVECAINGTVVASYDKVDAGDRGQTEVH